MTTRRYRWVGTSSDDLDNIIEPGAGATLDFLQRTPWTEITVADGTRDTDLDDFMGEQGYVVDTTGPTLVITSGPHIVGTEQTILVNATTGPITVTMPLTVNRLGNDVQVQKVDSSTNVVTVLRSGGDTIDGLVSQPLGQQGDSLLLIADPTNSLWEISQSRRAEDITFDDAGVAPISADNVQDAISGIITSDLTAIQLFTAGEALTAGDLVAFNASGLVIRANSSIASANWEVIGVANETVLLGATVEVVTKSGALPLVRFSAAPAGALNGSLVFIAMSSGFATPIPPVASGNTIFTIGTLQGANGITTTPTVLFRPQYIAQRR